MDSKDVVENRFDGSLLSFMTSYLADEKISEKDYQELMKLINEKKEG